MYEVQYLKNVVVESKMIESKADHNYAVNACYDNYGGVVTEDHNKEEITLNAYRTMTLEHPKPIFFKCGTIGHQVSEFIYRIREQQSTEALRE